MHNTTKEMKEDPLGLRRGFFPQPVLLLWSYEWWWHQITQLPVQCENTETRHHTCMRGSVFYSLWNDPSYIFWNILYFWYFRYAYKTIFWGNSCHLLHEVAIYMRDNEPASVNNPWQGRMWYIFTKWKSSRINLRMICGSPHNTRSLFWWQNTNTRVSDKKGHFHEITVSSKRQSCLQGDLGRLELEGWSKMWKHVKPLTSAALLPCYPRPCCVHHSTWLAKRKIKSEAQVWGIRWKLNSSLRNIVWILSGSRNSKTNFQQDSALS